MLRTEGLTVKIGNKTVCYGLDVDIRAGDYVAVLGGNGVGKTTLLHTLAGLRAPQEGGVRLAGTRLDRLRRRVIARHVGLLMQHHTDNFPATVRNTVLVGRHPHIGFWQWESREDIVIANAALADCALTGLEARRVDSLSGGERQRLAIATVLAQAPGLYLLDEPTNALDLHFQIKLLKHFATLVDEHHRAAIVTMHDASLAARFANRVLLLFGNGETLFGPTETVLTATHLSRLYGLAVDRTRVGDQYVFTPAI